MQSAPSLSSTALRPESIDAVESPRNRMLWPMSASHLRIVGL